MTEKTLEILQPNDVGELPVKTPASDAEALERAERFARYDDLLTSAATMVEYLTAMRGLAEKMAALKTPAHYVRLAISDDDNLTLRLRALERDMETWRAELAALVNPA